MAVTTKTVKNFNPSLPFSIESIRESVASGAGVQPSWTVPVGEVWELVSLMWQVTAGVGVATRRPALSIYNDNSLLAFSNAREILYGASTFVASGNVVTTFSPHSPITTGSSTTITGFSQQNVYYGAGTVFVLNGSAYVGDEIVNFYNITFNKWSIQ